MIQLFWRRILQYLANSHPLNLPVDSRDLLPHFFTATFLTARELGAEMLFAASFLMRENFNNSNAHQ